MGATDDSIKLLGGRYIVLAKVAAKVIAILAAAIVSAVTAIRAASYDAQEKAQAAKNKAEAGYQVTRAAMEAIEHRVLVLEQAARQAQQPAKKGTRKPAPVVPVTVTPRPKPLPGDLDKAEKQVYRGAPSPPPPDAAP